MRKQLVTLTIFSLLVLTISFPIYAEEITASENEVQIEETVSDNDLSEKPVSDETVVSENEPENEDSEQTGNIIIGLPDDLVLHKEGSTYTCTGSISVKQEGALSEKYSVDVFINSQIIYTNVEVADSTLIGVVSMIDGVQNEDGFLVCHWTHDEVLQGVSKDFTITVEDEPVMTGLYNSNFSCNASVIKELVINTEEPPKAPVEEPVEEPITEPIDEPVIDEPAIEPIVEVIDVEPYLAIASISTNLIDAFDVGNIIGEIIKDDEVLVIGKTSDDLWLKVQISENLLGYVASDCIIEKSQEKQSTDDVPVITEPVNDVETGITDETLVVDEVTTEEPIKEEPIEEVINITEQIIESEPVLVEDNEVIEPAEENTVSSNEM